MPKDSLLITPDLEQMMKLLKNNDEASLELLYKRNYPKVEKYILANNGEADEAKDIFQEAFVAVWRNIQLNRFCPQKETSLDGYLYKVAKHKWLDHLRLTKRAVMVNLKDVENLATEENGLSETEQVLIGKVLTNLKQLSADCRDVLELFYYQNQSMQKIAEAMNWTEATARNNKYRCMERLRKLVINQNNK